jgi:hypothetical protein
VRRVNTLRNILFGKSIRIFTVGATAIAASSLFVASPPASASTGYYVCETNGSYCVGAPNRTNYAPVVETTRYLIFFAPTSTQYHYKLEFALDPTKCVAAANNGYLAVLHPCNGGVGVVWILETGPDGHSDILENQEFSGKYLAGDNQGDQFHVKNYGANGWYYQFKVTAPS